MKAMVNLISAVAFALVAAYLVNAKEPQRNLRHGGDTRHHRSLKEECAKLPTNHYFQLINHEDHLSLHVEGGSKADGANVVYEHMDDGVHDSFRLIPSGFGNYYHIMAQHSNMAIAVADTALVEGEGENIVQQTLADTTNQDWCFIPTADGYYRIENRNTGQVINAIWEPNETNAGKNVYQWWYWGGKQQAWRVDFTNPAPRVDARAAECMGFPPNTFYHIVARHSGLSLRSDSSDNIIQDKIRPGTGVFGRLDNWRFVAAGGGYYDVINSVSGMALSVDQQNNLVATAPNEYSEWCLAAGENAGYHNLINKKSGYSIDVQNWSEDKLGNVATWPYYGGENQQFRIELATSTGGGGSAPVPTNPPTPPPNTDHLTNWKGPFATPVVGVALANFPNGKILMWSAHMREFWGYDTGETWTALYDPMTSDLSEKLVSNTKHDMFCPGTATLENGDMMVTGGADAEVTSIYHYETNAFTSGPRMKIPRGYHSMAVLGDGSIFTAGGSWHGGEGGKHGEVWSPNTNTWSLLPGVLVGPLLTRDTVGMYRSDNHFWLFQSPAENMLFHAGPSNRMSWINTSGQGSVIPSIAREKGGIDRMNGNALMLDIGIIFIVGGAANYDTGAGTKKAFIVDINDPANVKAYRTRGSMKYARTLSNSVVLPGGQVVVTGGQTNTMLFSDQDAVMYAEIYNPATGFFTTLPDPMKVPRTYHSTSILMIDGRVMVAGGGMCGGCDATHSDFEILVPPYLYAADGSLASRPSISASPATTQAGKIVSITMTEAGSYSFELLRTSSATHAVNNDQRRIPLTTVSTFGRRSDVQIPANRNVALVGTYYLFAINPEGIPSIGRSIQIQWRVGASSTSVLDPLMPKETALSAKAPPTTSSLQVTSTPGHSGSTIEMSHVPYVNKLTSELYSKTTTVLPNPSVIVVTPTPFFSPTISQTSTLQHIAPTPNFGEITVVTTPNSPVNLLANGSFEETSAVIESWGLRDPIGWSTLSGTQLELWKGGYNGVPAFSGKYFIELDVGSGWWQPRDAIYQDIQTVTGTRYELSFAMRARGPYVWTTSEQVVVEWAGRYVGTFQAEVAYQWTRISGVYLVGTGRSDRLILREVNSSDGSGPFLDDIRLEIK